MRRLSARFSRCLFVIPAFATLSVTACNETTTPPVPTQLGFSVQPTSPLAGRLMLPVVVTIRDASGNVVTSANNIIFLTVQNGTVPVSVSGTFAINAVEGVATFSDLTINTPGTGMTLRATSAGLTEAISAPFVVDIGPPSKVAFGVQPTTTDQGASIAPAIQVIAQDPAGNTVTAGGFTITLSIGTNPGGGTLSGTAVATTVNGIATFSNLSINNVGNGYTLVASMPTATSATSLPFNVVAPLKLTSVAAGYFHSCGLAPGGAAYCWSGAPIALAGGISFAKISAGRDHSCGTTAAGVAYCWGQNGVGQLGTGGTASGSAPLAVSGGHVFASANAGYSHSCGVSTAGVGYCWGGNFAAEIGDGTQTTRLSPTPVAGGLTFASISPGRFFSCGVTPGGAAYCWGDNISSTLGDGTNTSRTVPTPVSGGLVFSTVGAGGFHSCGLTTAGAAHCWGSNGVGQLGNGGTTGATGLSTVPVPVSGGHVFASLSVGNRHTCGVTTTGVAYCWGENTNGMVGDGSSVSRSTPVQVSGGLVFANISAGRFHSCGVTTSNDAYCWGENGNGQLGNTTGALSLIPIRVR